jgi:hypothetical protein
MCLILEIVLFVVGILTLKRGRLALSGNKVVAGTPAYVIGAIMVSFLPLMILMGLLVGTVYWAVLQEEAPAAVLMVVELALGLCTLTAVLVLGLATARSPEELADESPAHD